MRMMRRRAIHRRPQTDIKDFTRLSDWPMCATATNGSKQLPCSGIGWRTHLEVVEKVAAPGGTADLTVDAYPTVGSSLGRATSRPACPPIPALLLL